MSCCWTWQWEETCDQISRAGMSQLQPITDWIPEWQARLKKDRTLPLRQGTVGKGAAAMKVGRKRPLHFQHVLKGQLWVCMRVQDSWDFRTQLYFIFTRSFPQASNGSPEDKAEDLRDLRVAGKGKLSLSPDPSVYEAKAWSQWMGQRSTAGWGQTKQNSATLREQGFPCGSAGKESACNTGDLGLIPGLGRSPEEGKGYSLQYSGLKNSIDYTVHEVAKSGTRLSNFHF